MTRERGKGTRVYNGLRIIPSWENTACKRKGLLVSKRIMGGISSRGFGGMDNGVCYLGQDGVMGTLGWIGWLGTFWGSGFFCIQYYLWRRRCYGHRPSCVYGGYSGPLGYTVIFIWRSDCGCFVVWICVFVFSQPLCAGRSSPPIGRRPVFRG
ncbi:hypothetical protein QBC47DRAFT_142426 [Echria macrotheca]|uniref:Uncharacterized protein n=1 Tax=Echria macrotheca TaxID=438768 RepID=A0AAJ0BM73_9PEZI|nr:hypothetical protein QBC47DRAFT_142426 [Echria macrotheca]